MSDDDLDPVKRVIMISSYNEIRWLIPRGENHLIVVEDVLAPFAKMKRWCEQVANDTVVIWQQTLIVHFYFYDIADAAAFKLRWT